MSLIQYYSELPDALFQSIKPESLAQPKTIVFNDKLASSLTLPVGFNSQNPSILAGNELIDSCNPLALGYAGHQFGNLTPQLGDGRAHVLGQVSADNRLHYDLQLKGSGRTRYSRGGDGRSTLRAALREYIVSEYLHKLGIDTTRSLYVVAGDDKIMRDDLEQAAVVCRVAKSHLRIGSFQYAAMHQDSDVLKTLTDFTIKQLYPELIDHENPYLSLFDVVSDRLADLVASWMANGFIHGVMNTDNVLLSAESIDFGPCAFMGIYKPEQVFSSIDRQGRYAYRNQPGIMHWNLARLAESLIGLVAQDEDKSISLLSTVLNLFPQKYESYFHQRMCEKLALDPKEQQSKPVVQALLKYLEQEQIDFNGAFSQLAMTEKHIHGDYDIVQSEWFKLWQSQRKLDLIPRMCHVIKNAYFSNSDIETLLDKCVTNPKQATQTISHYFALLNNQSANELHANHPFDTSYRTFCGT
ncbi:protein adenylyltransferase SelO family protein [Pseudoalteromonas sp. XMcav1-K]|uniref:protein adenylyltransferase SelO family protein n=1 Tax=Pseudoalteromonas sp. XMcav1-K TaxID=3374372 RepID=UPI003756697B